MVGFTVSFPPVVKIFYITYTQVSCMLTLTYLIYHKSVGDDRTITAVEKYSIKQGFSETHCVFLILLSSINLTILIYLCWVCTHMCTTLCAFASENSLKELVLFFHYMVPMNQSQLASLGNAGISS